MLEALVNLGKESAPRVGAEAADDVILTLSVAAMRRCWSSAVIRPPHNNDIHNTNLDSRPSIHHQTQYSQHERPIHRQQRAGSRERVHSQEGVRYALPHPKRKPSKVIWRESTSYTCQGI